MTLAISGPLMLADPLPQRLAYNHRRRLGGIAHR
jgi:hypothetical protein